MGVRIFLIVKGKNIFNRMDFLVFISPYKSKTTFIQVYAPKAETVLRHTHYLSELEFIYLCFCTVKCTCACSHHVRVKLYHTNKKNVTCIIESFIVYRHLNSVKGSLEYARLSRLSNFNQPSKYFQIYFQSFCYK